MDNMLTFYAEPEVVSGPMPEFDESKDEKVCLFDEVKSPTHYYHYSNSESQGALIAQTKDFPAGWVKPREAVSSAYSDRMRGWDSDNFEKACKIAGGGDQMWSQCLRGVSDEKLKEFAKVALKLSAVPKHVRIIHYFNVSNGYSCPVVVAIYDTVEEEEK